MAGKKHPHTNGGVQPGTIRHIRMVGGHAGSINFCVDKTLLLSLANTLRDDFDRTGEARLFVSQDIKSQLDPHRQDNEEKWKTVHMSHGEILLQNSNNTNGYGYG